MTSEEQVNTASPPGDEPTKRIRIPAKRDRRVPPFLKKRGIETPVRSPSGSLRTTSLFLETRQRSGKPALLGVYYDPIYTLGESDAEWRGIKLPSFRKAYMEYGDPTGYTASTQMLDGWEHWERLLSLDWFKRRVTLWNREIIAKLRYQGMEAYLQQAKDGNLKAADWLLAQTAETVPPVVPRERDLRRRGPGRPRKADIQSAAREIAQEQIDSDQDLKRLMQDE